VEIYSLKQEVDSLRTVVKSYEERNINISDLEKKIRIKQAKFDNEVEQYKEKIKSLNKKIANYEEYIKKSNSTLSKDLSKTKSNVIVGDILVDKHKASPSGQINSLSRSTDRIDKKKEDIVIKSSVNQTNRRVLEKKGSMENLSHLQLNGKSKSVVKIEEMEIKVHKSNSKTIKDISMNSNNAKENSDDVGSKTYRKPTKELTRDVSKTNLTGKLTKHNRNNSYDIAKNEKQEKKTINSLKEITNNSNNNYGNSNQLPYFNNINIFAANMNNFKTSELNLKQFVINKVNNKTKLNNARNLRSSSAVKN